MFHKTYIQIMHMCMEYKKQIAEFQPLNLSTMTIIGAVNTSSIDMKYLSENFVSPIHPACILKKTKKHGDYVETKRGKMKKSFYNQVTIQYKDTTTKSIKIFSNGKLQITGITSLNEATAVSKLITDILNVSFSTEKFSVTSLEIGMINTNFSFGRKLDIISLRDVLNDHENITIDYEPDVYPGLKIKYYNSSIFIFTTGNVLITGVKSLEEVRDSLAFIVENTLNQWETLNIGKSVLKKQATSNKIIDGYKENEYLCAKKWDFK